MGNAVQHRDKANHHLVFLDRIPDDFADWLATVAFYAAVELVEELFADRDYHSKSHEDRKVYVRKNFQRVYRAYHALYNASLDARYQSMDHCLTAQEVRERLIGKHLRHIESFVASRSSARKQED